MISRRSLVFSGLALAARAARGEGFAPAPDAGFDRWKAGFRKRALAAGFDTGSVDGVFGPKTTAAIRSWQAQAGLPVDGVPSASVLQAVR
jgi:peptidoglycan hydrolase-like protein with peptidoglycan-binding domain